MVISEPGLMFRIRETGDRSMLPISAEARRLAEQLHALLNDGTQLQRSRFCGANRDACSWEYGLAPRRPCGDFKKPATLSPSQ